MQVLQEETNRVGVEVYSKIDPRRRGRHAAASMGGCKNDESFVEFSFFFCGRASTVVQVWEGLAFPARSQCRRAHALPVSFVVQGNDKYSHGVGWTTNTSHMYVSVARPTCFKRSVL